MRNDTFDKFYNEFKGWNKRKINIKASILADVLEKLIQEQDKKIDDLINARK